MVNDIRMISLFTLLAMSLGAKAMDINPDEVKPNPTPLRDKYQLNDSENNRIIFRREAHRPKSPHGSRDESKEHSEALLLAMNKVQGRILSRSSASGRHAVPSPTSTPPVEQTSERTGEARPKNLLTSPELIRGRLVELQARQRERGRSPSRINSSLIGTPIGSTQPTPTSTPPNERVDESISREKKGVVNPESILKKIQQIRAKHPSPSPTPSPSNDESEDNKILKQRERGLVRSSTDTRTRSSSSFTRIPLNKGGKASSYSRSRSRAHSRTPSGNFIVGKQEDDLKKAEQISIKLDQLLKKYQENTQKNESEDRKEEEEKKAFERTKEDAEKGDPGAQNDLAIHYLNGEGTPKNIAQAVHWLSLATEQNLAAAEYNLGNLYMNGEGVPCDSAKATSLYELAAVQGLVDAQVNIAVAYRDGIGVSQDYKKAVFYYTLAVENDSPQAMNDLSALYSQGLGVAVDNVESWRLTVLAAKKGNAEAQYCCGYVHRDMGKLEDAVKWTRLAADQGHSEAKADLEGVEKELALFNSTPKASSADDT